MGNRITRFYDEGNSWQSLVSRSHLPTKHIDASLLVEKTQWPSGDKELEEDPAFRKKLHRLRNELADFTISIEERIQLAEDHTVRTQKKLGLTPEYELSPKEEHQRQSILRRFERLYRQLGLTADDFCATLAENNETRMQQAVRDLKSEGYRLSDIRARNN